MTRNALPFISLIDVRDLLPENWAQALEVALLKESREAVLEGGAPSSLEPEGTRIVYRLIDGVGVSRALPWLSSLYANEFLMLAIRHSGRQLQIDEARVSQININYLPPRAGGYEWHVDTNPVTGVLFLSSHAYANGGTLELRSTDEHTLRIEPSLGMLALFDARACPHRVTSPVDEPRISAPMNFYLADQPRERPTELDQRLYTTLR